MTLHCIDPSNNSTPSDVTASIRNAAMRVRKSELYYGKVQRVAKVE
jgi:hypothetical protein